MKKIFLCLFILICSQLSAQMILHDPVSSRIFSTERYSEIRGTPFLYNKWMRGTATTDKGTYTNLELKLDVYNNTLVFNRDDEPYEFQDPVSSFTLIPSGKDTLFFRKGISGGGLKPDQYVQILTEGKTSAYRSDIRLVSDLNEINRGVVKTFNNSIRYFIVHKGQTQLVKLNKKEVLDVLNDQQAKLEAFISDNKISFKKEADLAKIVAYYNTL